MRGFVGLRACGLGWRLRGLEGMWAYGCTRLCVWWKGGGERWEGAWRLTFRSLCLACCCAGDVTQAKHITFDLWLVNDDLEESYA